MAKLGSKQNPFILNVHDLELAQEITDRLCSTAARGRKETTPAAAEAAGSSKSAVF